MKERRLANPLSGSTPKPHRSPTRVTLPIAGLTCGGGGALSVERALQALPGVIRAYVNPATEMAYVEYAPERVTADDLVKVVEGLGYEAVGREERW